MSNWICWSWEKSHFLNEIKIIEFHVIHIFSSNPGGIWWARSIRKKSIKWKIHLIYIFSEMELYLHIGIVNWKVHSNTHWALIFNIICARVACVSVLVKTRRTDCRGKTRDIKWIVHEKNLKLIEHFFASFHSISKRNEDK